MITKTLEDGSRLVAIETVKLGDYVRLVRNGQPTKKVYLFEGYDRSEKRYAVTDCEDILGNSRYLKKGTMVYVGFTY